MKTARSDPRNQQYNYFNPQPRLACSQLPVWSAAWFIFTSCRGAGFLFSSCIYSTEERKTKAWSSYLHKEQKHLSQDSCWRIEASGDAAGDHLPLIILNSFSAIGALIKGVRGGREKREFDQRRHILTFTQNEWSVTWCCLSLSHTHSETSSAPGSANAPFHLTLVLCEYRSDKGTQWFNQHPAYSVAYNAQHLFGWTLHSEWSSVSGLTLESAQSAALVWGLILV